MLYLLICIFYMLEVEFFFFILNFDRRDFRLFRDFDLFFDFFFIGDLDLK